jgi:hypothetical protein
LAIDDDDDDDDNAVAAMAVVRLTPFRQVRVLRSPSAYNGGRVPVRLGIPEPAE